MKRDCHGVSMLEIAESRMSSWAEARCSPVPARNSRSLWKAGRAGGGYSDGERRFPGNGSPYTGMLGMHGTKTSNYGVSECDLLVVLGARFSDRVTGNTETFAKNAKILQIDIDPGDQ